MKKKVIMICLMALGWGTYAQHNKHHDQKSAEISQAIFVEQEVTAAYDRYLDLQKALVQSNEEQAQETASELQLILKGVEGGKDVYSEALNVASATSLAEQRKTFTTLSKEMAVFVRSNELKEGKIYLGYCPMANGNTGGFWLTTSNEIRNPYFGDKMLKCGSIKEIIE